MSRGGFRPPFFVNKFGCLYLESLKGEWPLLGSQWAPTYKKFWIRHWWHDNNQILFRKRRYSSVSNLIYPDNPVLNPLLIQFVFFAWLNSTELRPDSTECNSTDIRQWPDSEPTLTEVFRLKTVGKLEMIRYCRNVILSRSAISHCKRLCMVSVVLYSVTVGTLTWLECRTNFVLMTGLFQNGSAKTVGNRQDLDAIWTQSAKKRKTANN